MSPPYGVELPRWGEPWAAFDQLRREIDRLLRSWATAPVGFPLLRSAESFPLVNLYETEDGLVLTAQVPGVRKEDLEVSVRVGELVLRGQRTIEYPGDASLHLRERRVGAFERRVALPRAVDPEQAEATCRNGVLTVRLIRRSERRRRQIQVR